jgi:hypothetical protein
VGVHGKGEAGVLAQRFELRASQWRRGSHPTRRIAGFCAAYSPPQKGFGLGGRTITKIDVLQTPLLTVTGIGSPLPGPGTISNRVLAAETAVSRPPPTISMEPERKADGSAFFNHDFIGLGCPTGR